MKSVDKGSNFRVMIDAVLRDDPANSVAHSLRNLRGDFGSLTERRELADVNAPPAPPKLKEQLEIVATSSNPLKRALAVWKLGEIGDPAAIPALSRGLWDDFDFLRWSCAIALGRISNPAAIPALSEASQGDSENVRLYAVEALGVIGHLSALPALGGALADPLPDIRTAAARALCRIGDRRGIALLEDRLSEEKAIKVRSEFAAAIRFLEAVGAGVDR